MLFDGVDERWQGKTFSHTIIERQLGSSALRRVARPRLWGSTPESHLKKELCLLVKRSTYAMRGAGRAFEFAGWDHFLQNEFVQGMYFMCVFRHRIEHGNTWCAAMTTWVLARAMTSIEAWRVMQNEMHKGEENHPGRPIQNQQWRPDGQGMLESCSRVAPRFTDCTLCRMNSKKRRKWFGGKTETESGVEIGEERKAEGRGRGCAVEVMDGQEAVEGVRYIVEIGSWWARGVAEG